MLISKYVSETNDTNHTQFTNVSTQTINSNSTLTNCVHFDMFTLLHRYAQVSYYRYDNFTKISITTCRVECCLAVYRFTYV